MSTVIEELAITLGLDLTQFEKDYATASKAVQGAADKLTKETRMAKIRMDIDMSKFDGAGNSVAALQTKMRGLNDIISKQKNVVELTNKAYQESVKKYGEATDGSKRLEERLLRQKKALADLESQLRQTTKAQETAGSAKWTKVAEAASRATDALGAGMAAIAVLSTKAAMEAVESESLFEISFGSMADEARKWSQDLRSELGLNEYALRKQSAVFFTMFNSMGLGQEKAYDLSTGLTKLAYDMASFYNLPVEQAFDKLKSGMTGEQEPLKALGILVDETTVKQHAWTVGIAKNGEELTQQQKVLARYSAIMEQTATAQGDMARTIDSPTNQLRILRSEVEQLEIELGQKLLPTLKSVLGSAKEVTDGFNSMSNANQDLVLELVKVGAEIGTVNTLLSGMAWAVGLPLPGWAKLAIAIGIAANEMTNYINKQIEAKEINASKQITGTAPSPEIAKVRKTADGGYEKEIIEVTYDETEYIQTENKKWVAVVGEELDNLKAQEKKVQEALASGLSLEDFEKQQQRAIQAQAEADKEKAKAEQQSVAATKAAQEEVEKLRSTDLENELRAIEQKAEALRAQKVDEQTITEYVEAAKAKAMEKGNSRTVADAEKVVSQLDDIWKTGLQNKLDAIEKEKQAYIKKGIDEVEACKWAEKKKGDTVRETALQAIQSQREYLEIVRNVFNEGFGVVDNSMPNGGAKILDTMVGKTDEEKLRIAGQKIVEMERKKLGIKPGDTFSPQLIGEYETVMSWVKQNLIPGMETLGTQTGDAYNKGMNGTVKIDFISGTSQQLIEVKQQVGTLTDRFAQVGQDSSIKFFAPFKEQLNSLVGNIDVSANKATAARNGNVITVNPTININNPQIKEDQDIAKIADKVADVMEPVILDAIGGNSNGY